MLDQLINLVKQIGQDTVVNNPEVPNEHNNDVMADATSTITSGFKNILAGGGFQNILDLFKGGGNSGSGGSGIAGLVKNPIVTMMVGYFISKLVGKYKMAPASASNVASSLIPNVLNGLINKTNDPNNPGFTLDGLIGSLTGGGSQEAQQSESNDSPLQNLLEQFTGGGNNSGSTSGGGGFNIQDLIGTLTQKAQNSFQDQPSSGGGGLMDLIKGFMK